MLKWASLVDNILCVSLHIMGRKGKTICDSAMRRGPETVYVDPS